MSTVKAELLAVAALRAYLLRTLPAKVSSINAERAAVLQAPRAGPYTIPADATLPVGVTIGSETATALTSGSRTASQIATELAGVSGLTASADSLGRLVLTSDTAPSGSTQSVVSLAADSTGAAAALGWSPGGQRVVRCTLQAPTDVTIHDGDPGLFDFGGEGFHVLLAERSSVPDGNVRRDIHRVSVRMEVLATEPNGDQRAFAELIQQAARAVREVILEDRTLDEAVHFTHLERVAPSPTTWRFEAPGSISPLFGKADVSLSMLVYERS